MDPFEEFEFKPLTEGLGFHNKNSTPKSSQRQNPKIDFNLEMMAPDLAMPMETNPQIQAPPIPSARASRAPAAVPGGKSVDEILHSLGDRKKYDFVGTADLHQTTPVLHFSASRFEISAALLDGMLIIAAYLTAMIILLVVTKVDLFGNLVNPDEDGMIYMGLLGLFASLSWIYLVATRMFLGFTAGEWVFDQRLGWPEQMGTASYSWKVALRSTVVIMTGFILIPLSSMLIRRDWLGKLLGVELIKKV